MMRVAGGFLIEAGVVRFSQEVFDTICERIANGESVREICRSEGMPAQATIYRWLDEREDIRERYARAREAQADAIFDEILEIADDSRNDWIERRQADGSIDQVVDHEHVSRSRLRIDARRWMAGKLRPKKYGDRVDLGGPDGGPLRVVIERYSGDDPSAE